MNILFLGDIVGESGRKVVKDNLSNLKLQYQIDLVIANGENAAHGKGITAKIYRQLRDYGIDVITMGNHTFSNDNIYRFIDDVNHLVRPANMDPIEVGQNVVVVEVKGKKIAVCNFLGEVFMYNSNQSPFDAFENILNEVNADIYVVDLHGEATSEKIAFTYNFAHKASVIVGTHTHVQTADERIVYGCAAITDLGMCGAYTSVLGRDVEEILTRFTSNQKTKYTIANGEGILCGVVVEIDDNTNRAKKIQRIQIRPENIETSTI